MKKILIYNIPMQVKQKCVYENGVRNTELSSEPFYYPINSYLAKNLTAEDDLKVILLVKRDGLEREIAAEELCKQELNQINQAIGARIEYKTISTKFEQTKQVYDKLFSTLIDEIEDESAILWDITFGPKDEPLVVFSALNFAEKFLDCEIEHIFYAQALFDENNKIISTKLVTMDSLFKLQSLVDKVKTDDSRKARHLLKLLVSL